MIESIQALINFVGGCFDRLYAIIKEPIVWLSALLTALVITPASAVLTMFEAAMTQLEASTETVNAMLDQVGVNQVGSFYSQFSQYVAIADGWVPASLAVGVAIGLTGLYAVCLVIRLIIRCFGILSGG